MSMTLNRPEKIGYWTFLAAENLERCKFVCLNLGRDELAMEYEKTIDRLKELHDLVVSAGADTQTFSRRVSNTEATKGTENTERKAA